MQIIIVHEWKKAPSPPHQFIGAPENGVPEERAELLRPWGRGRDHGPEEQEGGNGLRQVPISRRATRRHRAQHRQTLECRAHPQEQTRPVRHRPRDDPPLVQPRHLLADLRYRGAPDGTNFLFPYLLSHSPSSLMLHFYSNCIARCWRVEEAIASCAYFFSLIFITGWHFRAFPFMPLGSRVTRYSCQD
jgi:hypothetical protein